MVDHQTLKEHIRAYQFALYELALFMDTHPCDSAAMQLRKIYQQKLKQLIDVYEQHYGSFVQTHGDVCDTWQEWVSDPWPWDNTKKGCI